MGHSRVFGSVGALPVAAMVSKCKLDHNSFTTRTLLSHLVQLHQRVSSYFNGNFDANVVGVHLRSQDNVWHLDRDVEVMRCIEKYAFCLALFISLVVCLFVGFQSDS